MNNDRSIFLLLLQVMMIIFLLILEPQGIWKWALFSSLLIITGILLLMRFHFDHYLKGIAEELRRATNGNSKTRLFTKEDGVFAEVIFSMNELIEKLEKVQVQSIKSQEARKRLLSSISHDIRTPLTSIIGYVDALRDDIAPTEEEKQEYLEIISKKASSLKQLIDEIFTMAKLDADEMPLKVELLDLAEMARETVIEFLPEMGKQEMEFKVNIPEKNCYINADRLSLQRIIGNLMKNAIYYGKEGKLLGIQLIESDHEYQLFIWDQGPGISSVDLGSVFDRMYRGDGSRTSRGGSGLGLSIAKALVEKNGGRIWVESVPWEKTTFAFSMPKHNQSKEGVI
ncbi:sensor histidine kinase [Risungbinella massiliensis]|uniref:sensor histidine kinase n=1 Tax=Risungbinella massiliensis TaxID=1329796 RepID=UPI0005CBF1E6|nr:HAMP domain-containing sensor histidine kinase [Risungbinella massiliensis]